MRKYPEKRPSPSYKQGLAARLVATTLLARVIDDHRNLDALCDHQHGLKDYLSLDPRDRSLARAIAVSALRHRRHIETVISSTLDRSLPKRARFLIHSLHVAVAQILFLNIPANSAVDIAVTAVGNNQSSLRFRSLANAILRRVAREREMFLADNFDSPSSLPDWLQSQLRKDFGKAKLERISKALSTVPKLDLTVKSDPHKWAKQLGGVVLPTGGVRLDTSVHVSELEGFQEGEWWVQDAAASLPAHIVRCSPGGRILELCAAPGGKTAQLINMGYSVTALDLSGPRLNRLQQNLDRLKMSAELIQADVMKWEPRTPFDAVLIDVPCSSTGTIRRHPDVMWTKTPEQISQLSEIQFQMVYRAFDFVRPGGNLVFSNCSLLKQEGEDNFARLLNTRKDVEAIPILADEIFGLSELINRQGTLRSLPYHPELDERIEFSGMDGFFASRFRKRA